MLRKLRSAYHVMSHLIKNLDNVPKEYDHESNLIKMNRPHGRSSNALRAMLRSTSLVYTYAYVCPLGELLRNSPLKCDHTRPSAHTALRGVHLRIMRALTAIRDVFAEEIWAWRTYTWAKIFDRTYRPLLRYFGRKSTKTRVFQGFSRKNANFCAFSKHLQPTHLLR